MSTKIPKRAERLSVDRGIKFTPGGSAAASLATLALATGQRTLKLWREACNLMTATNLQSLAKISTSADALLSQWSLLIAENQKQLLQTTSIYLDIARQTQLQLVRLMAPHERTAGIDARRRESGRSSEPGYPDRRISAKLIQFPDRRVALGAPFGHPA